MDRCSASHWALHSVAKKEDEMDLPMVYYSVAMKELSMVLKSADY